MSADSLRKQSKQGNHGQVILPQPINDLSLIESVAGFIHEVVPQAYSSVLPGDSRDGILWARFDTTDFNDPENYPQFSECESDSTPPVLLILGYSTGVQVWSVGGSGEAVELLSWCQGVVRALRLLLRPDSRDPHSAKRPLVAIVDSSSPGPQFSTLSFISLKTAEVVKMIKFNSPICDVHCNRKSVVVTFSERIAVFDSATLEDRLTITTCYPSPGNSLNPIALGTRWLAYGEKRLTTWQRSSGGCEGDGAQSYTSAVIHAAKSLGKGLRELGGSLTGSYPQSSHNAQAQPGIVSIIDIERKSSTSEEDRGNMIAHFVAHTSAVVAMAFDPSGLLLITADRHGHRFNVFRIHPHPCTSQLTAVHHLYILHRGETTARVQDIAVSWDSRWVAVSSVRGTTHVFPITPYGGLVTVRTHTTPHVVNKLSRFERSAGLRDGRGSPLLVEAPTTPPPPRLPPYPHPTVVAPLAQLRARPDDAPLAAAFAPPRAWLPGRPKSKRTCADSLYIIYCSGALMQYDLDPKVIQGVAKEKVSFDTPIELGIEAKAEWILPKPPYTSSLCPPLPPGHLLLDLPSRSHPPPDKWLSQVEIVTHTGPHRRLWMGPQFTFKSIDPLPASGGEGEVGPEGGNPLRSNPVNMPHRPYLLVEIGSGSPQMAEVDEAGGRLREDLADAMLETQNSSGQAKGKLRRAEIEWQVNPLGAVQTHPAAPHSHWPHPIFFQPYSVQLYQATHEPSAQKSIDAILERLKQEGQLLQGSQQEQAESLACREENPVEVEGVLDSTQDTVGSLSIFLDVPSRAPTLSENSCTKVASVSIEETLEVEESSASVLPPTSQGEELKLSAEPPVDCPLKSDELSNQETLALEEPSSKKVLSEEKMSKPSGKKNRKKRNGADKKSKKEQLKQSPEAPSLLPPESQKTTESNITLTEEAEEPVLSSNENVDVPSSDVMLCITEAEQTLLTCEAVVVSQVCPFEEVDLKQGDATPGMLTFKNEGLDIDNSDLKSEEPAEKTTECVDIDDSQIVASSADEYAHKSDISFEEKNLPEDEENDQQEKIELSPSTNQSENVTDAYVSTQANEDLDDRDLNGNNTFAELVVEEIHPTENMPEVELSATLGSPLDESEPCTKLYSHLEDSTCIESCFSESDNVLQELTADSTLEGNKVAIQDIGSDSLAENDQASDSVMFSTIDRNLIENEPLIAIEICPINVSKNISILESPEIIAPETSLHQAVAEPEPNEFICVSSKSRTNKNRRRKKEKKSGDAVQPESSEVESSESVSVIREEDVEISQPPCTDSEKPELSPEETDLLDKPVEKCDAETGDLNEPEVPSQPLLSESGEESTCLPPQVDSEIALPVPAPSDTQSDQVASTDKSEIEDVSSHSGKESDDSKISKKERSRRQKRSESSDKDRSELKKKSASPSSNKPETKDSESSDEAGKTLDNKQCTTKIPKRKKGKKCEESVPEIPFKLDENTPLSTDVEESHTKMTKDEDKSLNSSSVESSSDSRSGKAPAFRGHPDHQNGIEDRDSVYESCNDDGASDSLAFESSKEDFEEVSSKVTATEPSSSNTEERTDSCDKSNQPLKKVRKQKKKKR